MRGREAVYLCADDTHGTAVMMRARQEGRSPEAFIGEMSLAHQRDFEAFLRAIAEGRIPRSDIADPKTDRGA